MHQTTLLIIKPDAVRNQKISKIIEDVEGFGFKVEGVAIHKFTRKSATDFYSQHEGRDFFDKHIEFMCSGNCVCLLLSADNAVQLLRVKVGATNPSEAEKGTLRYKYGKGLPDNALHSSDSEEAFRKETKIIFPELYY